MKFNGSMLLHANLWGLDVGIFKHTSWVVSNKSFNWEKNYSWEFIEYEDTQKFFADLCETAKLIENIQNCKFLKF